jgi:hypothetical protein
VSFNDIKEQTLKNWKEYQKVLNCENPIDSFKNICGGIKKTIQDLESNNNININDIYKLIFLQTQIDKAINYRTILESYNKA